jgi:septal ring factor EnvC (AmiA/AmiB activator)
MRVLKFLVNLGLLASLVAGVAGCSALDPRKTRDKELAETRAKLDQTTQLANELSTQVKEQQAEIAELKEHNVEEVRREKEQALAQIEIKRQELEQERYQIDRMRKLQQADVEEDEDAPKMSIQAR